jgi:hypothetical protein
MTYTSQELVGRTAIAQPTSHPRCPDRRLRPSKPHCWALVQVWNGAVDAKFDEEAEAREVMTCLDHDELVLLYTGQ